MTIGSFDQVGQIPPLDGGRHDLREQVGGAGERGHTERRQRRRVLPVMIGCAVVGQGEQRDDLYAGAGEGSSFSGADWGQFGGTNAGDQANPCGDPPGGKGVALTAPSAEGGALRSQSPLRTDGPTSLDGTIIRVVFPQLTEERRRDLVKVAKGKGEDAKVSIRSIRRHAKDALDKLVKDGETGEDDVHRAEGELDKLTGKYTALVDDAVKAKETELLEV